MADSQLQASSLQTADYTADSAEMVVVHCKELSAAGLAAEPADRSAFDLEIEREKFVYPSLSPQKKIYCSGRPNTSQFS